MHNLHLIRTKADSHSDALSLIEDYLLDWGTENNWSTVLGLLVFLSHVASSDKLLDHG
jgi:hypothetical protein